MVRPTDARLATRPERRKEEPPRGGFQESAKQWGQGEWTRAGKGDTGRGPMLIEGEIVANRSAVSGYSKGARVFHIKFGNGTSAPVDGNKLTVEFDKAGRKMVLESFVQGL